MHALALLAASTIWTSFAPNHDTDEVLRWDAPPPCPSRSELETAIAANLGRALDARDAGALTARAAAHRLADGRWQLSLTIEPRDAPPVARTVLAEQCGLLAEAAALLIAVAIDPELAGGAPRQAMISPTSRDPIGVPLAASAELQPTTEVKPTTDTSPTTGPLPARPRPSPPASTRPQRWPMRAVISAAAVLDVGALPSPAPGLQVRVGLLARRLRAEVGVVHLFERPARIAGVDGGGDLRLTAAQLQACPRFARARLELPVCAGLELGAMHGEGVGLPGATTDRVVWLAFIADGRVLWAPVPRFAFGVQLGLAAPLLAARFRVNGLAGDLHRAAPVSLRGALAIELRFP